MSLYLYFSLRENMLLIQLHTASLLLDDRDLQTKSTEQKKDEPYNIT